MYNQSEIDKALDVWKRIGSQKKTRLILGYPSGRTMKLWVREFRQHGRVEPKNMSGKQSKFTSEQKQIAIERALLNNGNISRTVRELGYPSRTCLKNWLTAYEKKHPDCVKLAQHPYLAPSGWTKQDKMVAVRELRRKKRTAISIAREYGVSRVTLYAWAKEYSLPLDQPEPISMAKAPIPKTGEGYADKKLESV